MKEVTLEIVEKALNGSDKSLNFICKRISVVAKKVINSKILSNRQLQFEKDDVCQEIVIKVYSSLNKFKSGNFDAWVAFISKNYLIDYLRKTNKYANSKVALVDDYQESEDYIENHGVVLVDLSNIQEDIENSEKTQYIQNMLSSKLLNKDQKEILELRYFEGKKIKEIAALTGKNLSSVKSILYRIEKQLENKLEKIKQY